MLGPLHGLTIIEMAGLGPGPFAAMLLADHGAEVVRIERAGMIGVPNDPLLRGRRSVSLDLARDDHREVVRQLALRADGLIEGYRPGVMEKLGLGPDALRTAHPGLVYGRVTGWGQDGPLSGEAGHDINYVALSGLLHAMGEPDRPPRPPLNLVGDYAGGGWMLAFGMTAALLAVSRGGEGCVIDAAMSEGAALTGALIYGMRAAGLWSGGRGGNLLDGGDPLYGCYTCADGKFLALGAIEPKFRANLLAALGIERLDRPSIAAAVAKRPRDEWIELLAGKDACAAPVLTLDEAPSHPHHVARAAFGEIDGVMQPLPAPRFDVGAPIRPDRPKPEGADTASVLAELGYGNDEIARLMETR